MRPFEAIAWVVLSASPAFAQSSGYPSAHEIVKKSIAWAQWHEKQNFHRQWKLDYTSVTRELDDDNKARSTETREYSVYPLAGEAYYDLIRRDGKSLTADDRRKVEKRRREFLEEVRRAREGKADKDEGSPADVEFNEDLINRYSAQVIAVEPVGSRSAYVIRFEPKPGKLPIQRRIDYALNKLRGKLWIDQTESIPLRVDFDIIEPVSVWAGLLGSVRQLEGSIRLVELGGGAWHFKDVDLRLQGRVLFRSLHQERHMEWSHFQRIPEAH